MVEVNEPVVLTAEQQRVVGSLVEKQQTTPDTYPLSLNALRLACNQSSSRDPVVDYPEHLVQRTADELKERGLVRFVHPRGRGVLKFRQVLDEALRLEPAELAVLGVLLLRGPQTVGELRQRTDRAHPFESIDEVSATLERLASRSPVALVESLPRRPGESATRWQHRLGPVATAGEPAAVPATVPAVAPAEATVEALAPAPTTPPQPPAVSPAAAPGGAGADRVARLEAEVAELRRAVDELRAELGLPPLR